MGQGWDRDGTGTVGRDGTGSSTISEFNSIICRLLTQIFKILVEEKLNYRVQIIDETQRDDNNNFGDIRAEEENATFCYKQRFKNISNLLKSN